MTKGSSINYVSFFRGVGVSQLLIVADVGEGGIWNADVSTLISSVEYSFKKFSNKRLQFLNP